MRRARVEVVSKKFDGTVNRSWHMNLVSSNAGLIELTGRFESQIDHAELGTIAAGTESFEYFWTERWYNVFRFTEPDGTFRNYYCNISMPPSFDGTKLEYIDLDLDILIDKKGAVTVLDDAEFQRNVVYYGYPEPIVNRARQTVSEVLELIGDAHFPFDRIG